MALTQYCDYDEIRAALGVNDEELADTVLALPIYEIGLARELKKVSASLPAAFSAALNSSEATRPATTQDLINAVRVFAAYTVAKQVGVSLATFVPKEVGDGKAVLQRFAGTPYSDTMERVQEALAEARTALEEAFATYNGTTVSGAVTVPTFAVAQPRLADPVTGS